MSLTPDQSLYLRDGCSERPDWVAGPSLWDGEWDGIIVGPFPARIIWRGREAAPKRKRGPLSPKEGQVETVSATAPVILIHKLGWEWLFHTFSCRIIYSQGLYFHSYQEDSQTHILSPNLHWISDLTFIIICRTSSLRILIITST